MLAAREIEGGGVLKVRFACAADRPRLAVLDPWPDERDWSRKIDASEVIVAEEGGIVVGSLRFEFIWTTVAFMSFIVVDPDHRGRGISRRLLDFLALDLEESGAPALLSSAQTDDPRGQGWHEHVGFERNGLIENVADEGVGEIVYRMDL